MAWSVGGAGGSEYSQLRGVVHVHSNFSSGKYGIDQLAEKAKSMGLEVVVVTDHDRVVMEYGIFPLRNLLKKRVERKSVLLSGPQTYLETIRRVNTAQNEVIVIPGVQSSPFYYWTGSAIQGDLTAHDYRKELLLIGMEKEADYQNIPLLHGGLSTRQFAALLPRSLVFVLCAFLGLTLAFRKDRYRWIGMGISVAGLSLLINHHPFQSSRFDPYHGDQGIAPYQDAIDYTVARGGLVFWTHPESTFSRDGQKIGPITLQTRPYLDDLVRSTGYTGFSAIYGEKTTASKPGGRWDELLKHFCRGERVHPVWAIAGSDFHQETDWLKLDTLQTVFLVPAKTQSAVLDALAAGRNYAVLKTGPSDLILSHFSVADPISGKSATLGETLLVGGDHAIEGRIEAKENRSLPIRLTMICNGEIWQDIRGRTPLNFRFENPKPLPGKSYYRLIADAGAQGRLLANPVFVVTRQPGVNP
ncbi:MAG TPA: PHP domain-containing protein [Desulfobacterales bacterium]